MRKINNQLGKYFILVSILSMTFITIMANLGINLLFSNYVKESRSRDDLRVVGYVEQVYDDYNDFNDLALMSIIHYTFSEGVTVRLRDNQGNLLWNSSTTDMVSDMGGVTSSESSLIFKNYPLNYEERQIGSIDVGRSKSIISSMEDRQFIHTINITFAIAFLFSVFIAMILSSRVSRKFLEPIYGIIKNVKLIEKGKYKQLDNVPTDTYELHELSDSIHELSDRLDDQELLRRRMTTDMAHELRTPLTTLQSHVEAFLDGIWEPDKERLTAVYEEIIRLTNLIKELSYLSIMEGEEIKLNKSRVNVSQLLSNVTENFKPLLNSKNISIDLQIAHNIELRADSDHLNRIFINLLSNAFKYTNENGNIKVTLAQRNDFVRVVVEDNGIGIPKEDIRHVFERFYRSDLSRNRGTGGTGIGLTITKALVEANSGEIRIESEEGKGTKVTCDFINIQG